MKSTYLLLSLVWLARFVRTSAYTLMEIDRICGAKKFI